MLIDFDFMVNKYGIPKGVIHIGAHLKEEAVFYNKYNLNVIWIEGNPRLCDNTMLNYIISDVDDKEYDFNIANNGHSSSILQMDKHLEYHKDVYFIDKITVKSKTMKSVIEMESINMELYDFLVLDIQGADLLALKGFGDYLKHINYIFTEVNEEHLYKDCGLINEMDEFLSDFDRVETYMTENKWGDALYVRRK